MRKSTLVIFAIVVLLLQACDKHIDISEKNRKTLCSDAGHCITVTFKDYHLEKEVNGIQIDTINNLNNQGVNYATLLDLETEDIIAIKEKIGDANYPDYIDNMLENNQTEMLTFTYNIKHDNVSLPEGKTSYSLCGKVDGNDEIIHLYTHLKFPHIVNDQTLLLPLNLDRLKEDGFIAENEKEQKDLCVFHYAEIGRMGGDKDIEISNILHYSADELNDALTTWRVD